MIAPAAVSPSASQAPAPFGYAPHGDPSVRAPAPARPAGAASSHWPAGPRWLRAVDAWMARPRTPRFVVVALALYLLATANWALWLELAGIGGAPSLYMRSIAPMAVLVGAGTVAVLAPTAWSRGMKPVWMAIVLLSAVAQHYMLAYHVVIDPTMAANAMQTDLHETRDLVGWGLAFHVLLVALLPAWWLLRVRLVPMRAWGQIWRNAVLLGLAVVMALACVAAASRELAPLMRNHVTLRYMMNPLASLYSAGSVVLKPLFRHSRRLIPVSGGAA